MNTIVWNDRARERSEASHANGARRRSGARPFDRLRVVLSDVEGRESVWGSPRGEAPRINKELNERHGKSIIMVTHDPSLAREYAHRTITMLDGAVVAA